MAGTHQKRTVETEFTARDAGHSSVVGRLQHSFDHAAHSLHSLHERMHEFRLEQGLTTAAALGLGMGFGAWFEKVKEVNAEFYQTQKGLAGVLAGALDFGKGVGEVERYNQSLKISAEITEKAEGIAGRYQMGLEEVGTIYKKLAISAGGLGLSQEQVENLMVSTAATARRFGVSGEIAASSIARAMKTGAVRGVDEFSLALGRAIGPMRNLNQAARFDHIQRALQGSVGIADAMGQGIGGALSRARVEVAGVIRELTSPIFSDIAKRLGEWSKKIHEAREGSKPLITEYADKLLSAFKLLADLTGKIREHWVAIAAVAAGMKVSSMAASGQIAGMLGGVGPVGVGAGIQGAIRFASGTVAILGTAQIVGNALGDALAGIIQKQSDEATKDYSRGAALRGLETVGKYFATAPQGVLTDRQSKLADKSVRALEAAGVVVKGQLSRTGVITTLQNVSAEERLRVARQYGLEGLRNRTSDLNPQFLGAVADKMADQLGLLVANFAKKVEGTTSEKEKKFAKSPVVNINGGVHVTMKFEDQDPDAVALVLQERMEDYVNRKTQSAYSERLGD